MKRDERFDNGVEFNDFFAYTFWTFGSNFLGFLAFIVFTLTFRGKTPFTHGLFNVTMLITLLVPAAITSIWMVRSVPQHYFDNEGRRSWLNNGLWAILPGELLRFLFTLIDLGSGNGTGRVALIPSMMFEQLYMIPSGIQSRDQLVYNAPNLIAYACSYLGYLAVNLALLLLLYRLIWRHCEKNSARHAASLHDDAAHDPEKFSH